MKKEKKNGFTLIEILVVIGIIAILAAIVIVAINPARQFAQARNTQRESAVSTILNGVGQNMADNKGIFTCGSIGTSVGTVASPTHIGTASGNSDLKSCLVPTYIAAGIPVDPDGGADADTLYTVGQDATTKAFTVCALKHAESAISGSSAYCLTR